MKRTNNFSLMAPAGQLEAEEAAHAPVEKAPRTKQQKVFVVTEERRTQIDVYCAQTKTSIQDLVIEGINMVFESKGLPRI